MADRCGHLIGGFPDGCMVGGATGSICRATDYANCADYQRDRAERAEAKLAQAERERDEVQKALRELAAVATSANKILSNGPSCCSCWPGQSCPQCHLTAVLDDTAARFAHAPAADKETPA